LSLTSTSDLLRADATKWIGPDGTKLWVKRRERKSDETLIYRQIRQVVPGPHSKESGTRYPAVQLAIERLSQKARREAHRMKGFVRFTKDDSRCVIGPPFSATRG
jgi:hypothetical protein